MLGKGRILKTGTREDFEALRDSDPDELGNEQDRLVRQFLRGDAVGPITDRNISSDYEDDLLMVRLKGER
jgi:hypothetical protein